MAGSPPGQFDLLKVGGAAKLGGTLQLVQLNGFQFAVGNTVTFLTANGGVSGTFGTVVNPFSTGTMIGTQVVYGANSVSVQGVQTSFAALVAGDAADEGRAKLCFFAGRAIVRDYERFGSPRVDLAETQNQMAVADGSR